MDEEQFSFETFKKTKKSGNHESHHEQVTPTRFTFDGRIDKYNNRRLKAIYTT